MELTGPYFTDPGVSLETIWKFSGAHAILSLVSHLSRVADLDATRRNCGKFAEVRNVLFSSRGDQGSECPSGNEIELVFRVGDYGGVGLGALSIQRADQFAKMVISRK